MILAGIFFNLISTNIYALNYADYSFNYEPDKTPGCIQVTLKTQTDNEGKAVFRLPQNVDIFFVHNPEAKLNTLSKLNRIALVQQNPNEEVSLRYESCFSNPSKTIKNAIYEKDLLFFAHEPMLILPLGKSLEEKWHYIMDYSNLPKNFHIVSSYPVINKKMDVTVTFDEFKNMATLAGDFIPKTLTFEVKKDKPIHYIQIGNWDWLKEKPEFYIRKLLTYQRAFWQNDNPSDYFIVFSSQKKTPFSNGIYGTHFKNFITLSITPNTEHKPASIIGISHELFHGWIGDKANFKNPLESITWLVEGFTDYYGARFALESGAISFSDYVDYLNKNLIMFYSSPIRNMSLDQALTNYDSDKFVYKFELIKGSLIAHKMAKLKDSNNNRIMDKIIKTIYFKIKENHALSEKEQKAIVREQFTQELGKEQWEVFEDLLKFQKQVDLSEKDFDFLVEVKIKSFNLPHYHFDMNHFIMSKEIKDLHLNSPEYRAGLRNRMKVVQHNILFHKPINEVIILVENENKKQKTIKFQPKLALKKIPHLIAK
jgi:predicted metalloprotease with PDZ domain